MNSAPGPRDWLPPTSNSFGRSDSLIGAGRPRYPGTGPAIVSVILGVGALALAVAPFIPTAGGGRFVVSIVGLSAIAAGIRSIAARRGRPGRGGSALTTIGIGCGAIATLVMAATWTSGGSLPSLLPGTGVSQPNFGAVSGPVVSLPKPGSPQGFAA